MFNQDQNDNLQNLTIRVLIEIDSKSNFAAKS